MEEYKTLFLEEMEKICNSNCIKELIFKLKEHNKDKNNIILDNSNYENYINYVKNNIMFFPFFNNSIFFLTITLNGKIIINDEYRKFKVSTEEEELYNFYIWIVMGIYEVIGHFLKDYFYYLSKFIITEESGSGEESAEGLGEGAGAREGSGEGSGEGSEEGSEEGLDENSSESIEIGKLVEKILFSGNKLYLADILYILDLKNWNKNLNEFCEYFKSGKRKKLKKNGLKEKDLLGFNEECFNILAKFKINKTDLLNFNTDVVISFKKKF